NSLLVHCKVLAGRLQRRNQLSAAKHQARGFKELSDRRGGHGAMRKEDFEGRAVTGRARHVYSAIHACYDAMNCGKAKPCSANRCLGGEERLEDTWQRVWRNTTSVVFDA